MSHVDIDITDAEADAIDAARGVRLPDCTLELVVWRDEDGNLEVRLRRGEERIPLPESVLGRIAARLDGSEPDIMAWVRRRAAERSAAC